MKSSSGLSPLLLTLTLTLSLLLAACSGDGGDDPVDVSNGTDVISTTDVTSPPEDVVEEDIQDPVPDTVADDTGGAPDVVAVDVPVDIDFDAQPPHRREPFEGATGSLEAGVALGYLDGPVGTSMAGFGGRVDGPVTAWSEMMKGSRGFSNGQSIKAIALEVDGELAVILKTPLMSGETSVTYGTLRRLKELYDLDLDGRVIFTATHSHHTTARYWRLPMVFGLIGTDTVDDEVLERMCTVFAEVIKAAIDDLGPAEYGAAYAENWDPDGEVYTDRREENDEFWGKDARLSLVAVQRPDGTPMATVINFGMHGTSHGKDNDLFNEDSGGAVERAFEDEFFAREGKPIFGMYVQSGGGDARPNGGQLGHPQAIQRIEVLGRIAAPRIYDLYKSIEWQSETTLAIRSLFIDLRYDWMGYDENDEFIDPDGKPYRWGALSCEGPEEPGGTTKGQPKKCSHIDGLLGIFGVEMPFEPMHQTYLTTLRLGDTFLLTLPGEPTASLVDYMRTEFAERADDGMDVICVGYSQDHLLYITSYEDWFLGGFEAESTIWGPLGGEYLVDRQLALVSDILDGYARPAFYEEFPRRMDEPVEFTPHELEASSIPAAVREDVEAEYGRGQTVRFAWAGGDASIASPYVWVERELGGGGWAPVPSPAGWVGYHYDNLRHYMVTTYEPDPPANASILEERMQQWAVAWQIPLEWPAGNYRLVAAGQLWDGAALQDYELTSTAFAVGVPETLHVEATLAPLGEATQLLLTVTQDSIPAKGDGHVPTGGFRVFDTETRYGQPLPVRAPLTLTFSVDGVEQDGSWDVSWDATAGAYLFDFGQTGLATAGVTVNAHLSADIVPAIMSAPITE